MIRNRSPFFPATILFVLLSGLLLLACDGSPMRGEKIRVPQDPLESAELAILPVFYVPADRGVLIPDPTDGSKNIQGGPIDPADAAAFDAAERNLEAALRIAQARYRQLLIHPVTGADRGTFRLATWDRTANEAKVYDPRINTLEPLLFTADESFRELQQAVADQAAGQVEVLPKTPRREVSRLLTRVGCSQMSCPFIFVIVVMRNDQELTDPDPADPDAAGPYPGIGGVALNHGYNGGSGFLILPYGAVKYAHQSDQILQSTMLHELGHCFGLSHNWEAYEGDERVDCSALSHPARYSMECSSSVMSYNLQNQIFGCVVPDPAGRWCNVPDDVTSLSTLPGDFLPEEIEALSINQRAFPGLLFERQFEAPPGNLVAWHPGPSGFDLVDHDGAWIAADGAKAGAPWQVVGFSSNVNPPPWVPFDEHRMWKSNPGPLAWSSLTLELPKMLAIDRLRVLSGAGPDGDGKLFNVEVYSGDGSSWTECAASSGSGRDRDVLVDCGAPSRHYRVRLQQPAFGFHIVLRGLRLFAGAMEIFPPREPVLTLESGTTQEGSLDAIAGGDQVVQSLSAQFDPSSMWRSTPLTQDQWATIRLVFPFDVTLEAMGIHGGFLAGTETPKRVRLERRLANGSFATVTDESAGFESELQFPATTARVWRLGLHPGASGGRVVLRGLRFYEELSQPFGTRELFEPRQHP